MTLGVISSLGSELEDELFTVLMTVTLIECHTLTSQMTDKGHLSFMSNMHFWQANILASLKGMIAFIHLNRNGDRALVQMYCKTLSSPSRHTPERK